MTTLGTEPVEGEVVLGRFRLDRLIGKGGMGKVYRAEVLADGGLVAVKVLSANAHDDETRRRFAREAAMMARVDHPNLVRLLAHGEERGYPFLVMPFLDGKNLLETIDTTSGRLGATETLDIVGQVAAALDHLHALDIIHRDIKLSNIFLGPEGKVTLLDMGLARAIPSTTQLTRVGVIWGTPEFMSPEQIMGESRLDGRTDVYALGGIFYRVLSGRLAFDPGDEQKLLEAHVRAPRPDLKAVVPSVPQAVADTVKQALAVNREERFPTATAFVEALRAAFAGLSRPTARAEVTVVARPSPREPDPVTLLGNRPVPSDFEEPMTMPAHPVAATTRVESNSKTRGPDTVPPRGERTVITDLAASRPERTVAAGERTVLTEAGLPLPRPTDTLDGTLGTEASGSQSVSTGPGLDTDPGVERLRAPSTKPPAQTVPGRRLAPRTPERKGRDEPALLADLPVWATPWVMVAMGAGLLLTGFLLGLLLR